MFTSRRLRELRKRNRRTRGPRARRLGIEALEKRCVLNADFPEFVDPNPNVGNQFGSVIVPLSTGNVVITSPSDDAGGTNAGAVYLFNGATGALILEALRGQRTGPHSTATEHRP